MGFLVSLSEIIGFWIGIPIGILLGFFIFIYYEPRDVKVRQKFITVTLFLDLMAFI